MSAAEERTKTPGIYRRGNRYHVRWRDRYGRSHRRSARTLAEARDVKAQVAMDRSQPAADRTVTLRAYAAEWCDTYQGRTRRGLREATRAEYRRTIDRDVIPFFGAMRLADVTPRDVKRYIAAIGRRGIAPDTVRLAHAPLRLLLTTAHEDGVIPTNPAAGVRAIVSRPDAEPVEATRARALTTDELDRLLQHLSPRWRLLVRLLAETGLRISEALALRWDDVDLGRRRVSVRRRLYRGRIGPPKSKYGRRDVPITAALGRDLWAARKSAAAGSDTDPVFATLTGGYLLADNARRAFTVAAQKAGITDASLHTLRHTCATELFRRGLNAKQAQVWLGHHSPAFTLATYVHLLSDDLPESPFEFDEGDTERDTNPAEPRREPAAAEPAQTLDLHAASR